MARGSLPLFLVCASFPSGQGFVRFELGAGESLVIGNYSSAMVKPQPCHACSPQGSAGLLHSPLATGEGSGGLARGGKLLALSPLSPEAGLDAALPPWSRAAAAAAGAAGHPFSPTGFLRCSCGGCGLNSLWDGAKAGIAGEEASKRTLEKHR